MHKADQRIKTPEKQRTFNFFFYFGLYLYKNISPVFEQVIKTFSFTKKRSPFPLQPELRAQTSHVWSLHFNQKDPLKVFKNVMYK